MAPQEKEPRHGTKNEDPLSPPTVTSLQLAFLDELSTGIKTGKVLRARLLIRGWDRSQIAFYRIIRRLKEAGLITARRVRRDAGEYRGAQAVYQLTEPGWDVVVAARESDERIPDRFMPGPHASAIWSAGACSA